MKVHIIGMAGSGKTSLARWLAAEHRVRAHDLDWTVYDASGERPEAAIVASIHEIRRETGWVTEGAYRAAWLTPLLDDADAIVWLDYPFVRCAYWIVKRHIRAEMARNNPHPGWRRLFSFLDYNRRTAARQRAETRELLALHRAKVIRCRSSCDLRAAKALLRRRRTHG